MRIFTRYGSQVEIIKSYKAFAKNGVFLVQARIITPAIVKLTRTENTTELVGQSDSFNRGWIPSTHLVSDGGPGALLSACVEAPSGTPVNVESMLRVYWPALFGQMQIGDVVNAVTINANEDEQTNTGPLSDITARFGGGHSRA